MPRPHVVKKAIWVGIEAGSHNVCRVGPGRSHVSRIVQVFFVVRDAGINRLKHGAEAGSRGFLLSYHTEIDTHGNTAFVCLRAI
ncbi:hypothetical protein PAMC26510_18400 [Caballeronia sordidicola]|uniref:Uncharacterized protein n=1 Tax=Caballeronia sordidicola TaxID=196367 RepID=A0A242MPS0_CABSO|nr:hypothetical protein PAMC26510_18400 [Caballeronia sordidicola]